MVMQFITWITKGADDDCGHGLHGETTQEAGRDGVEGSGGGGVAVTGELMEQTGDTEGAKLQGEGQQPNLHDWSVAWTNIGNL